MNGLCRAAAAAFVVHLIAGLSMALILSQGLETTPDVQKRLAFVAEHRALWTFGWLTWTAAAIAILYFYVMFVEAILPASHLPIFLTVAGLAPDLSAQAIEIGVLPSVANNAELFLTLHRVAIMLSGYLANGLYSVSAMILAWRARYVYPFWVTLPGIAVSIFGIALSVAALLNSVSGMFWANVVLMPVLLFWLAGIWYKGRSEKPSPPRNTSTGTRSRSV